MRGKCAIYARLSREDEDKYYGSNNSKSIENQIQVLSDYAKEKGFEIYKIYIDDGASGATLERKGLKELVRDMRAKKFNILLIKDLSRLGRSLHKLGELVEEVFPKNGIRVISLGEEYDSAKYNDEDSIVLYNFLNDYYLKDVKRKSKAAKDYIAHTKHMNYYPKYGYKYDSEGREVVDERSASIVRRIFDLIGNHNMSTCAVAVLLNKDGIKTRSEYQTEVLGLKKLNKVAANCWNAEKVWEVVRDYEYCGHSVNYECRGETGQIILYNTHKKIIDDKLFDKAQATINKRSTKKRRNHLGKILIDRHTGKKLLFEYRRDNSIKSDYFLRVNGRRQYVINAEEIENVIYNDVISVIKRCKSSKEKFKDLLLKKNFGGEFETKDKLESVLKRLNEEYANFVELYFNGKISAEKYVKKSAEFVTEIKQAEDRISRFNTLKADAELFERRFKQFLYDVETLPENKKEVIRKAISKVYIDSVQRKEFHITVKYKFEIK